MTPVRVRQLVMAAPGHEIKVDFIYFPTSTTAAAAAVVVVVIVVVVVVVVVVTPDDHSP